MLQVILSISCICILNNILIQQLQLLKKNKASSLDEVYKSRNNLLDEQESILGILTSNLNQKKKVTKVTLACSEATESDKYLAHLGENDTSYCLVLTKKNNIDLAKRYLTIFFRTR